MRCAILIVPVLVTACGERAVVEPAQQTSAEPTNRIEVPPEAIAALHVAMGAVWLLATWRARESPE